MAIIGISLGTTKCAAAICADGKPQIILLEGEPTLPAVVGLQKNGKIAVGKVAKRNQARALQNTIVEVKRKMGAMEKLADGSERPVMVALGEQRFLPQQISAMILKKIKESAEAELGEEVTGVVITCPVSFTESQRAATKEAGQIAGLNVLKILNEPTAAAYAYGVHLDTTPGEKLFIVYDLGGAEFTLTVIRMNEGLLEVLGTGGDPNLGGGDFDDRIVNWMLEHLKQSNPGYAATLTDENLGSLKMRLKSFAEEGKIALCDSQDAQPTYSFQITNVDIFEGKPLIFSETLTMAKFEELIKDLQDKALKRLDVAMEVQKSTQGYTEDNLTAILLVGGSTRVPQVRRILERRFPGTPIRGCECGINASEIVVAGAASIVWQVNSLRFLDFLGLPLDADADTAAQREADYRVHLKSELPAERGVLLEQKKTKVITEEEYEAKLDVLHAKNNRKLADFQELKQNFELFESHCRRELNLRSLSPSDKAKLKRNLGAIAIGRGYRETRILNLSAANDVAICRSVPPVNFVRVGGESEREGPLVFLSASSSDCESATQVFRFLSSKEIRVFFSRESLPELGSSDYRKKIDEALDEAEHMVLVTSSRTNVNSPWVEAEWGLFINEKRFGRKTGNLLTLIAPGLSINELPASLRYYEVLTLESQSLERLIKFLGPRKES